MWVPRVILFIPWVGYEFLVRRPVGWVVRKLEHSRTPRAIFRALFMGIPTGPGITPLAYYDFGFQPSLGVRLLWEVNFLGQGSKLTVKMATWGRNWLRVDFQERAPLLPTLDLVIDSEWWRRPDRVFYGLGSRSRDEHRGRFREDLFNVQAMLDWNAFRATRIKFYGGVRHRDFQRSRCCDDISVDERVARGDIEALPPGYERGYGIARTGVAFDLDTRLGGRGTGSAFRAEGHVEYAFDSGHRDTRWWRWGGGVGGVLHLDNINEKVLSLWVKALFLEPGGDSDDPGGEVEVPFTEMVRVGGTRNLRGFPSGRMVDSSGLFATLSYRWPLAAWIDATLYLGTGNVFGENLAGFKPSLLRGSFGLGFSLAGLSAGRWAQIWTAVGTEPWDEGFEVTSFRLVLGWSYAP